MKDKGFKLDLNRPNTFSNPQESNILTVSTKVKYLK